MLPLNECLFYVQIQAAKPVCSDSSLDKLWWSCYAWPIESLETSYGSLDLYMKYTFSWEATSPLYYYISSSKRMFLWEDKCMDIYLIKLSMEFIVALALRGNS